MWRGSGARCDRGIVEEAVDDAYDADRFPHEAQVMLLILRIKISQVWSAVGRQPRRGRMGETAGRRRANTTAAASMLLQVIPRDRAEAPPAPRNILYFLFSIVVRGG